MIAPGKIMIQKIAVDEYDGVELSEETQDTFGTVISIGRPQLKMYFWWEILLYWFGKHPFPFKVGGSRPQRWEVSYLRRKGVSYF